MIIALLVVLGLIFGSFVNALVWRVHEQAKKPKAKNDSLSVLRGRSMCPHCRHELAARDLVPVFSWLSLKGRCRYCKKPISAQYPVVEAAMAAIFALSYVFWPGSLELTGQWALLITWLAVSVALLSLLVYDYKWMELPNRIIYPAFGAALLGRLVYITFFAPNKAHSILMLALSILVASGMFWLLYTASGGRWIGYGDVRLGLVTGTLLAGPDLSFLMIFLASIIGTLAVLPGLALKHRSFNSKLPFGPFLIAATAIALLFGGQLIDWYKHLFLPY